MKAKHPGVSLTVDIEGDVFDAASQEENMVVILITMWPHLRASVHSSGRLDMSRGVASKETADKLHKAFLDGTLAVDNRKKSKQ